jgi:hypothetical protein
MSIWHHVQVEQTEGGVTEGGEDQDGAEARGSEENEKSRRSGEIQITSMLSMYGSYCTHPGFIRFLIKNCIILIPMPL